MLRAPPTALSAAALTSLLLCNAEGDNGTVGGCRNCTADGSNRCAVCWDFYTLTPDGNCARVRRLLVMLHPAAGSTGSRPIHLPCSCPTPCCHIIASPFPCTAVQSTQRARGPSGHHMHGL